MSFRDFPSRIIDDSNFVARHGLPTGNDFSGVRLAAVRGLSNAAAAQGFVLDAIYKWFTPGWRQRQCDCAFGKTIDWRHRAGVKTIPAESLGESTQGVNANGLRAVGDKTQRAQIETDEVSVINLLET